MAGRLEWPGNASRVSLQPLTRRAQANVSIPPFADTDVPEMRRWSRTRVSIAIGLGNFACAASARLSPWIGYGGTLATVLMFLFLRSPPESEDKFIREARAHEPAA